MNYSLNKFIQLLIIQISEIEMIGFDECEDKNWDGKVDEEVHFSDCVGVLTGSIRISFSEGKDSRDVSINELYLQFDEDKIPFTIKRRKLIEEELKL